MTQHAIEPFGTLARGTRRLFVDVSDRVADNLAVMALKAGVSRNLYVSQLFNAAYSARCAPTGDRELDAAMQGPATGTGAPANPRNMGSRGERDGGLAVLEREIAAATEREGALGAELEKARKSLLDYAAQIGNAARIEREGAELKAQLAEAKANAARDAERLEGARGAASALRDDRARQQKAEEELKAEMALRARDSLNLAAKLDRAETVIREMNAQLEAQMEASSTPIAALEAPGALSVVVAPAAEVAPPIRALTAGEAKIVRGWAAVGRSIPSIAAETGFSREQIAATLKKRAV
jgi:hypothetical protein